MSKELPQKRRPGYVKATGVASHHLISEGVALDEGREGGLGGANSASYYINDPFGHSSKEVLYNTLYCSHHMPAYPRKII